MSNETPTEHILRKHVALAFGLRNPPGFDARLWKDEFTEPAESLVSGTVLRRIGPGMESLCLTDEARLLALDKGREAALLALMDIPTRGYVLMTQLDQTVGYLTSEGEVTVLPSEARVFVSGKHAEEARSEENDVWINAVPNVAAFRMHPPEWNSRPASMRTLFELAAMIGDLLGNENLRSETWEVRSEAYLLQSAAHVFTKALGHQRDGKWVFGPKGGES